jgi:hypothetical protein
MSLLKHCVKVAGFVLCRSQVPPGVPAFIPAAATVEAHLSLMISRCHSVLRTTPVTRSNNLTAALPRRGMSSSVLPPGAPKLIDTVADNAGPSADRQNVKAAVFGPDTSGFAQSGDANTGMSVTAFAGGPAASPAGSDMLVDDEAAPLRFKGTTTARRGRTAVPGTHLLVTNRLRGFGNPL